LTISLYSRINLFGADGIALSADRSTLYYCQVKAVHAIGSKRTTTDGMHADNKGNVFYTMLEGKGVGIYTPSSNRFHDFVSDDRMLWVDGAAFDQKSSILFNNNQLHEMFGGYEIDWTNPYNLII
jgi:sugar lactone lactonase YvrE